MARRRRSASPGVKPASATATRITCSWKMITPRVSFRAGSRQGMEIGRRLQPLAAAQVGMDHAALDRARPHDRHLDHDVLEALRLKSRKHLGLCTTLDLEARQSICLRQ